MITGITGFVGQNLISYLSNMFEVKGILRQLSFKGLSYVALFER